MLRRIMLLGLALILCVALPMAVLADRGAPGRPGGVVPPVIGKGGTNPGQGIGVAPGVGQGGGEQTRTQEQERDTLRLSQQTEDETPVRERLTLREQIRVEKGDPFGLLRRTQAWMRTHAQFEELLKRVDFLPFMAVGQASFEEGAFQFEVAQGNRWALEALNTEGATWLTDDAMVRVVWMGGGEPSRLVTWDEFSALVSDCPEATVRLFGTVEEPAVLHVRFVIAQVPCMAE